MIRTGSCQCGQVRYEVEGKELALAICYCTECQKVSAGIATYSMFIPRSSFRLVRGTLKQCMRMADSGARNQAHFCPDCGVRIFHENPDQPDIIRIKAGSLDAANTLEPEIHAWTASAPPWIKFPDGALVYPKQGDPAEIMAALAARRSGT